MKKVIPGILFILIALGMIKKTRAQDWANLNHYKAANAKVKSPTTDENRVVFMGNSITLGWQNANPKFFNKNAYINRGINGQTTPQMLIRFRQDVIALQPKVVVILAGTNDIAGNTGPSSLETIAGHIKSMAELAHANHIKVILCSILPAYEYPWKPEVKPAEKIITLNAMLQSYCKEKGHLYLDYFCAMADDRNGLPKKYALDGVHPTKEGYRIMEPLTEIAIDKALAR